MIQSTDEEFVIVDERRIWLKILSRMQLLLMLLIIMSSLDRVNISFAALQMNQSLGMTPETFGFAVGIFFLGYLLFQFPSTSVQQKIGTRRWIFITVVLWGTFATGMALVKNAQALYALRFLLGVAESGLSPGIVYYCSGWMPRRFRAGAIATTLLAIPISVIIGGPLSGWLMSLQNPVGLPGWRWMFLLEGLPTIALAFIAYALLSDQPAQAKWLTEAEKQWLTRELAREEIQLASQGLVSFRDLIANRAIWASAGVWFATLLGSNGIIFWLPQVLKQLSGRSDFEIGLMSSVPWIGIGLGMILNSWHSDKAQERYFHVGIAILVGGGGLAIAASLGASFLALLFLFFGGLGIGGAQGVFWTIPSTLMSRGVIGRGITLINLVGNLASLTGPYLIGVFRQRTGSFSAPIYILASVLVIGALLLIPISRSSVKLES